jgi:SNF2 family DNA or RNA helicase
MLKTSLRDTQKIAVKKAKVFDGFALFPEQRTGKTLVSLALVDYRKPDVLFIVCPKRAIGEWERQIERHLTIDWSCEVEIINFEAISATRNLRKVWREKVKDWKAQEKSIYMICDEAHRIKKRGSNQSGMVRSLGKHCRWRLALTGTPIAQGIWDSWAIFDFTLPGQVFGTFEEFKEEFLIMDTRYGPYSNKVKRVINEEEFYELFHKYSYRITLAEARVAEGQKAPLIRRRKIYFGLEDKTWDYYNELESELETYVQGTHISTPLVLTLTMKLQQLAGGFLINDTQVEGSKKKSREIIPIGGEKLRELERLLLTLMDRKLVICCRFRHEIQAIRDLLDKLELTFKVIAGGKDNEWDGQFNAQVIILQIQSGIAIDLAEASDYIFYSWDFSLINYEQARFRILSFATKQANYYYLLARGTVDESIYQLD